MCFSSPAWSKWSRFTTHNSTEPPYSSCCFCSNSGYLALVVVGWWLYGASGTTDRNRLTCVPQFQPNLCSNFSLTQAGKGKVCVHIIRLKRSMTKPHHFYIPGQQNDEDLWWAPDIVRLATPISLGWLRFGKTMQNSLLPISVLSFWCNFGFSFLHSSYNCTNSWIWTRTRETIVSSLSSIPHWKERNARCFRETPSTIGELLARIKDEADRWILAGANGLGCLVSGG